MLERAHGLTGPALEAIADLERRVLAADGGRLKLEWGVLRRRPHADVRDLLWWEDERLAGFLGIYSFSRKWLEVTGMVAPEHRRRGIGRALFEAALPICRSLEVDRLLVVVPRNSGGGHEFVRSFGLTHDHSEHALTLGEEPDTDSHDPRLSLRKASADDIPALSRLYLDGFGDDHVDPQRLASDRSSTLLIERDGQTIGTVAVARDGARGAIYGLVVSSAWRGHGIGHQVLRRCCRDLFAAGAERVDLEVEVANDRALGLYTSVGFTRVTTEDYYGMSLR